MKKFFRRYKALFAFAAAVILLALCATGCKASSGEKTVSYSELDSYGQSVVDIVYSCYDSWETMARSGGTYDCSKLSFFRDDEGVIVFAVFYATGDNETGRTAGGTAITSVSGFSAYAAVNTEEGTLEGYSGSGSFPLLGYVGQTWDASADEQTQKDVLADVYAKRLLSE